MTRDQQRRAEDSHSGTIAVHFSPTAKFLIVYQKANAVGAGEEKNLSVWNTESGEALSCFQVLQQSGVAVHPVQRR